MSNLPTIEQVLAACGIGLAIGITTALVLRPETLLQMICAVVIAVGTNHYVQRWLSENTNFFKPRR